MIKKSKKINQLKKYLSDQDHQKRLDQLNLIIDDFYNLDPDNQIRSSINNNLSDYYDRLLNFDPDPDDLFDLLRIRLLIKKYQLFDYQIINNINFFDNPDDHQKIINQINQDLDLKILIDDYRSIYYQIKNQDYDPNDYSDILSGSI